MSEQQSGVALVTGASSGIGAAIARRFAAAGYRVLATGRSDFRLEALGVDFPGIERVVADLASAAECARVVARCVERLGRLDVLVNNAGIGAAPNDGYDKCYERMAAMNEQLARGETPTVHLDHIIDFKSAEDPEASTSCSNPGIPAGLIIIVGLDFKKDNVRACHTINDIQYCKVIRCVGRCIPSWINSC